MGFELKPSKSNLIPWKQTLASQTYPWWKETAYKFLNPLLSIASRRHLSKKCLEELNPKWVLPARGMIKSSVVKWATRGVDLSQATLLIQGTGSGWDTIPWAQLRPAKIIATDLFEFDSWGEIQKYCFDMYKVPVEFVKAPLENHSFLESGSVDVCGSFAVLEHCRDLDSVLAESRRVLKGGGRYYADYGPIWHAPGGDHFSSGDDCYAHLVMTKDDYERHLDAGRNSQNDHIQGGIRYYELDLFSKLTTSQYMESFKKSGFKVDEIIVEISPAALRFKEKFPERWLGILAKHSHINAADLILKAHYTRAVSI